MKISAFILCSFVLIGCANLNRACGWWGTCQAEDQFAQMDMVRKAAYDRWFQCNSDPTCPASEAEKSWQQYQYAQHECELADAQYRRQMGATAANFSAASASFQPRPMWPTY